MAKNQDRSEQYVRQVADELIEQIKRVWHPGRNRGSRGARYAGEPLDRQTLHTRQQPLPDEQGYPSGHSDNRWGTYKQIEALGGHVRKGERGTKVLYYTDRARIAAKDEGGKPLKDKDGKGGL